VTAATYEIDLDEEERWHDERQAMTPADRLRAQLLHGDHALANLPRPEPLVEELLDLNTLAALFGSSGSGKTFVAIGLSLSIAAGRTWHGRRVHGGKVLYVAAEGAHGLRDRTEAWKRHNGVRNVRDVAWLPTAVNLFTDDWQSFAEVAAEFRPALIAFDTLSRCVVGADENSARDMGRIVDNLDRIRRATGACVLAVHHTGKNPDAGLRGSSVLAGALDTVLRLDGSDGYLTLRVEKQKYRADGEQLRYRLKPVERSLVVELHSGLLDAENLPSSAIEMLIALDELDLGAGVSSSAWESGTNVPRRTFYRHLKRLAAIGLSANVGSERRPLWTLQQSGKNLIECHGANTVPRSATAPSESDSATVPPPLWGGTNGTDTAEAI
jgi:hypothetical protein